MSTAVKILMVEDSADDATLALLSLRRGGFDVQHERVDSAAAMAAALGRQTWDAVIADYRMPGFTGLDALRMLKERDVDVPFILISATIGEETAVAAMKAGANDYLMKENLARLAPALARELQDAAVRAAHRQAQRDLLASEARYRALTELSADWYWEHDEHGRFLRVSDQVLEKSGIEVGKIVGKTRWETGADCAADKRAALEADIEARRPYRGFEFSRVDGDGVTRHVSVSGMPMFDDSGRYLGYRGVGTDITAHKQAEDGLRIQAQLLGMVGDAVIACDAAGNITYMNNGAERLYGWNATDARGRSVLDMLPNTAEREVAVVARQEAAAGSVWRGEIEACRRDGTTFPAQLTLAPVHDDDGTVTGLIGVSRDISEQKRTETTLETNATQKGLIASFGREALANTDIDALFRQIPITVSNGLGVDLCGLLELGSDGQSLAFRAGLGRDRSWNDRDIAEALASAFFRFVCVADEAVIVADFESEARFAPCDSLTRKGVRSGIATLVAGADRPFGILVALSRDVDFFPPGSADFLQAIANTLVTAIERRNTDEKLDYLGQFDALTGLPNRNLFRDRLTVSLSQARHDRTRVGAMFLDLDRFESINDTLGRDAGDQLLALVARRLEDCVSDGGTVARLDGDKFALALPDLAKADDANAVVQRVTEALANPFNADGHVVHLSASLGIAVYPDDGDDCDVLLNHADTAMHRAKKLGRNTFQFYTAGIQALVANRIEVERELHHAIEQREFRLYYQPEISLDTGRIIGVEALIRWQHPVRGLLAPAEFIAVAEETGLIVPIGQWVVETACAQLADWHHHGYRNLFAAVNLSTMELRRGDTAEHIRTALARTAVDPRHLVIEVTETMGIGDADAFLRTLDALKAIGVTIAIDDFGTGYSILSYLKRFPIDTLKIDRMFITDIVNDGDDAAIVQAIIAMSHELQLTVTAEGVETEEQAGFLRRLRCDNAQGYLFGRPVPAAQLSALLDSRDGPRLRSRPRHSPRSLLLVDADRGNLSVLHSVLGHDGYDIYTAASGEQALELLAATPVTVIVADQHLAGMSGTEFLGQVRARHPDTVRLVLCGYADMEIMTTAINDNVISKFLLKPWENRELRDHVWQAFRLHETLADHGVAPG